ncbi:hypothetical protein JCM10450v2_003444 [Rhodotorula kratochvilovae]
MLSRSLFPLALLVSTALALSPADLPRAVSQLSKRDLASDVDAATNAAMGLASSASEAIAGGGACSSECTTWMADMTNCASAGDDEASLAGCACGADIVKVLDTCASCIGGDAVSQASTFKGLCSSYATMISSGGLSATSIGSAATSAASSTKSAASSAASATQSGDAPSASAAGDSAAAGKGVFGGAAVALGAVAVAMLAV